MQNLEFKNLNNKIITICSGLKVNFKYNKKKCQKNHYQSTWISLKSPEFAEYSILIATVNSFFNSFARSMHTSGSLSHYHRHFPWIIWLGKNSRTGVIYLAELHVMFYPILLFIMRTFGANCYAKHEIHLQTVILCLGVPCVWDFWIFLGV